jgi:hypothetical protein
MNMPLVATESFTHGTVECTDMAATRKFLTEFLGLDIIRPLPEAQYMWKGGSWSVVCVGVDGDPKEQSLENRFKLAVETPQEVDAAHAAARARKDEFQIRDIRDVADNDGKRSFVLQDLNFCWWEITNSSLADYDALFAAGDKRN